jgi:dihydroorotase
LGSSTGDMLVDDPKALEAIFSKTNLVISVHCEDEVIIRANLARYVAQYKDGISMAMHPEIRSEEACYASSSKAVALAKKTGARLHVFHLSTAKETRLFNKNKDVTAKKITAEVCIHHLWFSDQDYDTLGSKIKWNPSVKKASDRLALRQALLEDRIDVIATDHAPHTWEEKTQSYIKAPSGGPMVQHALVALLDLYHQDVISLEKIVEKFAHNPAKLFEIKERGFVREGYKADLVLVDLNAPWTVNKSNILYKCGWSPFEGTVFKSRVTHTFVNGMLTYEGGKFVNRSNGERLTFDR